MSLLATNMISVGLDIPRLGLTVVQGQPKTAAEYIVRSEPMTSEVSQGFSQFLFTCGPGAMTDLPELPVAVAGLDGWEYGGDDSFDGIHEGRLTRLLADLDGTRLSPGTVPSLRTPPRHDPDRRGSRQPGVAVRVFPSWFVLDEPDGDDTGASAGETRRRMATFDQLTVSKGRLCYKPDKRPIPVSPVRFVAACPDGHLKDIDWRRIVHGANPCARPLHRVERGVSSDPVDGAVRCACGRPPVSLANLHVPRRLGACDAFSPWLSPRHEPGETCEHDLRLLARSATDAYFPQTVSVISMPAEGDAAAVAVADLWSIIEPHRAKSHLMGLLRDGARTGPMLKPFPDDDILTAIASHGASPERAPDPRIEEFDRLSAKVDVIGRDGADSRLLARRLPLEPVKLPGRLPGLLAGLVRVDRLREVACIYGFTRLDAAPSATESELDEISLATRGAPLARHVAWSPAVEQFGEGIFVRFDSGAIEAWAARDATRAGREPEGGGEAGRRPARAGARAPRHRLLDRLLGAARP